MRAIVSTLRYPPRDDCELFEGDAARYIPSRNIEQGTVWFVEIDVFSAIQVSDNHFEFRYRRLLCLEELGVLHLCMHFAM